MTYSRKFAAALAATVCVVAIATPAYAQVREYNISGGSLKSALDAYARQSGRQIIYKVDEVRSARSRGAKGSMSADDALDAVLAGSGFTARRDASGALAIVRSGEGNATAGAETQSSSSRGEADAGSTAADSEGAEILVTGSRIRGAPVSAPVIVKTAQSMRDEGQTNLGDFARSLPQSFAGGQNPGVTNGAVGQTNTNVSSGSSFNLRGLGPDATLTLLNGNRLAYNGAFQAVDVSAIPLAAIDRVEVVADGASSIYGSDAVGGVVNVILKNRYEGLSASARFGAATDGGDEQQEYSLTGGTSWNSGGILAVANYSNATQITARQRNYTLALNGEQPLLPSIRQYSGLVSANQHVLPNLKASVDLTYNHRDTVFGNASSTTAPPSVTGIITTATDDAFSISPRLELSLPSDWRFGLSGTYSKDDAKLGSVQHLSGNLATVQSARYSNSTTTAELGAEGTLLSINGNRSRVAIGVGYRSSSLTQHLSLTYPAPGRVVTSIGQSQDSYYAYGEIFVPIIANGSAIRNLSLTGAVRYENYTGMGDISTPKLGLIFEPTNWLQFKGSWGKSYKAPTLYQRYVTSNTYYYNASTFGAGYPMTATAIQRTGGNPNLRPERSTNWSASMEVRPFGNSDLVLGASYFEIHYTDRVVTPITTTAVTFSTPSLQPFIIYSPTLAQQAGAIAGSPVGLTIANGKVYDPASVVALIDNRNTNATSQDLRGIDLNASYLLSAGNLGTFSLTAGASYLKSSRVLLPGQAPAVLAGTTFDPPSWRGRGSVTWNAGDFTLNSTFSYIGPLIDDRYNPAPRVDAFTTLDATARYRLGADAGLFSGLDLTFSVLNLLNEKPTILKMSSAITPPYDSTNHSSVGRFVNISISRSW